MSVRSSNLISIAFIPTLLRPSVPRLTELITAPYKGNTNGKWHTSHARDERCLLHYCMSVILIPSRSYVRRFHEPSKTRMARCLTVWHWIRSLRWKRSSNSIYRSRQRCRLARHSHLHLATLLSSSANLLWRSRAYALAFTSPAGMVKVDVGVVI